MRTARSRARSRLFTAEEAVMEHPIKELYGKYLQGRCDRREFLKKLSILAGGTAAASFLLPLLENRAAQGAIVPKGDPRLIEENIQYPGATGEIRADFARPKGEGKLPGVVVIHEIWGLNAHIEDVTRRVALEGFLAIAPDALSSAGGTPENPAQAATLTRKLDGPSTINNYLAALKYLKSHPRSTGKVGCIGFCWGGGIANQLAVNDPDLAAAVPFYGIQPASQDVPKIKASLLIHYAGIDERINKGIPAFEEALKKASIDYKIYMYPGAKHAFLNDTNPDRYNKEAAQLAWQRTIAFLKEKLKK
jgi:carboxymethylenebutenolidase